MKSNSTSGGWYSDYAFFVTSSNPWFVRGGYYYYTTDAGAFNFIYSNGVSNSSNGFRSVLVN